MSVLIALYIELVWRLSEFAFFVRLLLWPHFLFLEEKEMKKIVGIFLCLTMFISVIGCTNPTKDKYAEATQLMESGKYIEAQKIFEELLNYKDCHNKAKQCKYLYAVQLVNESDYYAAIQAFNNVSFEDSKEKISEVLSIAANKYLKNQISKEEID